MNNTDINKLIRQLKTKAHQSLAWKQTYPLIEDNRLVVECQARDMLTILHALEWAHQRINELEASQPVITSQVDDPMRTNFTCDLHQTDYGLALYFTRLGLPENVHQLYRNEAEALYLGLKSALCKAAPALQEGEKCQN